MPALALSQAVATSGRTSAKTQIFGIQLFAALAVLRILRNTVYRTNLDALWCLVVSDALGAKIWVDYIELVTFRDCVIRALRFTDIAVYTVIRNS